MCIGIFQSIKTLQLRLADMKKLSNKNLERQEIQIIIVI